MFYYEVAVTGVGGKEVLTYEFADKLEVGAVVSVAVGRRNLVGVVMKMVKKPDFKTKSIEKVLYDEVLPGRLMAAAEWMAGYYATPLPVVWQTILPRG